MRSLPAATKPGSGRPLAIAVLLAFLPGCLALVPTSALPPKGAFIPGHVVIEFAPGTSAARMKQVQQAAGATPEAAIATGIWRASVAAGTETRVIAELQSQRDVLHAEFDLTVHDEMVGGFRVQVNPQNPLFNGAAGLPGQWGVKQISAPAAWDTAEGAGVEVAVVDTGVDISHPDLVNNLDLANAANTFDPPDSSGKELPPKDDFGHGTHVAGIIAAQLGTMGTVGVAPLARIIPIRVLGVNGGTTTQLIAGLDHVLDTPARIVNLSLGSEQSSAIEQDEIDKLLAKNILVVAAAGNEALDGNPLEYPASIPGVVSVGATKLPTAGSTDPQDQHAAFSNFNPFVTVAAPGVDILSTVPRQFFSPTSNPQDDEGAYAYASGTSMAAPMVSGVAALIRSAHPNWSAQQIEAQLLKTAGEPPAVGPGFSSFFGYGVVNALAAVTQ